MLLSSWQAAWKRRINFGRAGKPVRRRLNRDRHALRGDSLLRTEQLEGRALLTNFSLQILHASDLEGGVDAIDDAPNFAAVVQALENEALATGTYSVTLSAGDNMIRGPFFSAAGDRSTRDAFRTALGNPDAREGVGRGDIAIMNIIGFDASALGNHEFDAGTSTVATIIGTDIRDSNRDGTLDEPRWLGADFPYLSANLDFAADAGLSGLATDMILSSDTFFSPIGDLDAAAAAPKIAPATLIPLGLDHSLGVVGATTPLLGQISSPGDTDVLGSGANNMAELAAILQPTIDALSLQTDEIVLVSHLQQIALETELASLLHGVDIIIAGGSDTLLADATDTLRPGDSAMGSYPIVTTSLSGEPVAIVSTDGQYNYVGRLVVDFVDGLIDPLSIDPLLNGAYATDDAGVAALWGNLNDPFLPGTKGSQVAVIADALRTVVLEKDTQVFGRTDVFLEGRRTDVRTQETNLGNLTADANLAAARAVDPTVQVSIKNGGGIRAEIGAIDGITGELLPPQGNPISGKQPGEISQLDIENSLRFNNELTILTVTAAQLWEVMEHSVSASGNGATPGQFPQVGGMSFSYDSTAAAGSRIEDLVILDDAGAVTDVIVAGGDLVGDPGREIRAVTLNFLAGGGDGYPFPSFVGDAFTPLLFDIGNGPVAAGYTGVTSAATYSPALGYGWLTAGSPVVVATGSDLERDFVQGSRLTFAADVAPGTYYVSLLLVDHRSFAGHDQIQISLEGVIRDDIAAIPPQEVVERTYSVLVNDGQLTIDLNDLGGLDPRVILNAVRVEAAGATVIETGVGEQTALADYLTSNFSVTPFNIPETPPELDQRIVDLSRREIIPPSEVASGGLELNVLGTIGLPGAEIGAYDPSSQTMFVTGGSLTAVNISDPLNPSILFTIEPTTLGFNNDEVTHVAVSNGLVAASVPDANEQLPGNVLFFDTDGNFIDSVEVGALPDMVTFTPDGNHLLVANEGEADGTDPLGSVSLVDLTAGVGSATVVTADFTAFDGREEELRARGVRIFPGKSVSEDVEPEYIAVSPDGTTAFVTLQEANAFGVLDIASATFTDILPMGVKDHSQGHATLETFEFADLPVLGTTAAGQDILLGGLSGLSFEEVTPAGNLRFLTIPDRGPNGASADYDSDGGNERPFALPDYQAQILRLDLNPVTGEIALAETIPLFRGDGVTPITGLPNIPGVDEEPIDLLGNLLPYDEFGADMEGIAMDDDGSFWTVDEYRPAIYHFDAAGVLMDRFVPAGTAALAAQAPGTYGTESLPAEYVNRRANRGFEGMALDAANNRLYAFIQTPLSNPDRAAGNASNVIRILEIDTNTGSPVAEFVYLLEKPDHRSSNVDKIGDAVLTDDGKLLVIERDSAVTASAKKFIFEADLTHATNVLGFDFGTETLEQQTADDLLAAGIVPVAKRKVVNLPSIGYLAGDKPEGLTLLPDGRMAVINDNDFGLLDENIPLDGTVPLNPAPTPVVIGLIDFAEGNRLDTSDRDDAIRIVNAPVFGMFMPDGMASYEVGEVTYYLTANEGDARDEDVRIKDVLLDPTAFPNAAILQQDAEMGRLQISSIDGDPDGDGDYDQLFAYGGRSFSIWDEFGNLVFDSGDQFERFVAGNLPAFHNADDGDVAEFDNRSDNKGPEPEGVTVGEIEGQMYAFVGLERGPGGVMVYNITDPLWPHFVTYLRLDGDISPEGLQFISAADSPTGAPMLGVTNEVSNTLTLFGVDPGDLINGRTSSAPYVFDISTGAAGAVDDGLYDVIPLLTVGDEIPLLTGDFGTGNVSATETFAFPGIPDGIGVFQTAEFNYVFVNHELNNTSTTPLTNPGAGDVLQGSRVSLIVFTPDWRIVGGRNLIEEVVDGGTTYSLNPATGLYEDGAGNVFNTDFFNGGGFARFCSSYLASYGFLDPATLQETPLYFTGEESGGGRGWAISPNGTAIPIDGLGKYSKEQVVAASQFRPGAIEFPAAEETLAFELDQQLQFSTTGNLFENWGGLGEKWFWAAGDANAANAGRGWYFVTPDGNVHRWDRSNEATGPVVATLTPDFHQNPELIYDAPEPMTDSSFGETVLISLEDSGDGEVYMYVGQQSFDDPNGLLNGQLYVMRVVDAFGGVFEDEVLPLGGSPLRGEWVPVPDAVALGPAGGLTGWVNGTDSLGDLRSTNFQRPEDVHEDPNAPGTFYFVTTGSGATNRLGKLYRFTLNPTDPAAAFDVEFLLEGGPDTGVSFDNIVVDSHHRVIIQEDRSAGGGAIMAADSRMARVFAYDIPTGNVTHLFEMNQAALDPGSAMNYGAWESSGIVEVSAPGTEFGRSSYLLDVQAHTFNDPTFVQGGQLLLTVPQNSIRRTQAEPYVFDVAGEGGEWDITPILTVGDEMPLLEGGFGHDLASDNLTFAFQGIPDGLGIFATDDAFYVFVNHEFGNTANSIISSTIGGSINGSRVSLLKFTKNWEIIGGRNLVEQVEADGQLYLLNTATGNYEAGDGSVFNSDTFAGGNFARFCSGYLAEHGFLAADGSESPLWFAPEESGGGRAFAVSVDGTATAIDGLGRYSKEQVYAASQYRPLGSHGLQGVNQQAFDLDTTHNFVSSGNQFENWGGQGEKWFWGRGEQAGWYFITPNGEVSRWDGSEGASGSVIGSLNSDFHADLSLLVDAANGGAANGGAVSGTPASGQTVLISLEDAGDGEVYMFVGQQTLDDPNGFQSGDLYVLQVRDADGHVVPDEFLAVGEDVTGHWTPVPDAIALGSATGLSNWVNAENVLGDLRSTNFQRPEDIHEDPNNPGTFYFVTTGRSAPNTTGRLYSFTLNAADPTGVMEFDLLLEGGPDTGVSYDNMTVTTTGQVIIQEDRTGDGGAIMASQMRMAQVFSYDISTGEVQALFEMNQAAIDPSVATDYGNWESSGVVEVPTQDDVAVKINNSHRNVPLLLDVQAHSLNLSAEGFVQGGQLLLATPDEIDSLFSNPLQLM